MIIIIMIKAVWNQEKKIWVACVRIIQSYHFFSPITLVIFVQNVKKRENSIISYKIRKNKVSILESSEMDETIVYLKSGYMEKIEQTARN